MQIYLARDNVQAGPYSLDQVNQMLKDEQVALTDLMWHDGMDSWQPVGTMTNNTLTYYPRILTRIPTETPQAPTEPEKPVTPAISWLKKDPAKPTSTLEKNTGFNVNHARKILDLAPIGSRILAKLLDIGLYFLTILPLYLNLSNNPKFENLMANMSAGANPDETRQLLMSLVTDIPTHILSLTYLMLFALLIAQVLLLKKRGQSIGKMAMGIRILDIQSNAIPTFTNIILLRSIAIIALFVIANLPLDPQFVRVLSGALQLFFIVDFISMFTNKEKQSLHDKIAKTYVVRADDTQTTPLELEPTE